MHASKRNKPDTHKQYKTPANNKMRATRAKSSHNMHSNEKYKQTSARYCFEAVGGPGWTAFMIVAKRSIEFYLPLSLERLQAARAGRDEDRAAEVARNVESAGHALTQQDRERDRVLEQERALERQRVAEREGPDHSL